MRAAGNVLYTPPTARERAAPQRLLEEGFGRYEHAVMANYHPFKTVDNEDRQRSAILQRLDAIERDSATLEHAAEWYAAQRGTGRDEGSTWQAFCSMRMCGS